MIILSIDSSATAASAALVEDSKLIGEFFTNTDFTHSRTLAPMIENLLNVTGKKTSDVNLIAVSNGPGSFTGVRIGVSVAKGIAFADDLPCIAVSTLEAMASSLGIYDGYICPVMDARRSQVYNALFEVNLGQITRIREDRAISLQDLAEDVKILEKPIFLVGDGSNLCYNTLLERVPNLVLPPEHRIHQRAVGVGLIAARQASAGIPGDAASLTPNYLRLSQAERERLEREQKKKEI